MITIQNFEERLKSPRALNTFFDWTLVGCKIDNKYYEIVMQKSLSPKPESVTIRLYREMELESVGDDREKVYKIEFIDSESGYSIYEHFCTINWLRKPPNNLMMRLGEIINQYVVNHPRFGIGPIPF